MIPALFRLRRNVGTRALFTFMSPWAPAARRDHQPMHAPRKTARRPYRPSPAAPIAMLPPGW